VVRAYSGYGKLELPPSALQFHQSLDDLEQSLGAHEPADVDEPQRPVGVVRAFLIGEPHRIDGIGNQMDLYPRVKRAVSGQLRAGQNRDHVARNEKAPQDPGQKGIPAKEILRHRSAVI